MKRTAAISTFMTLIVLLSITDLKAQQQDSITKLVDEFRQIQQAYSRFPSLSFEMQYRYTNETKPSAVLDSVFGKIEMQSGNLHYVLDSTETIKNDRYSIILFKEDKMMYLSKPDQLRNEQDPLQLLDSAFAKIRGIKYLVKKTASSKIITLIFPTGMAYKRIEFAIDPSRGLVNKITYIVKTELLLESQDNTLDESQYDEYARVELSMNHYSTAPLDSAVFDEHKYFLKEGKDFKTTEPFKQYKIFIGSLNL